MSQTLDLSGNTLAIDNLAFKSASIQASAITDVNSTHALAIVVNGTTYYVPLHTAANFGG